MQESKEKISSRMIKNASRLWGFQDTQAESSFDPVVGLILGALASELAKISTDINTVEARILEKLVDLLTPEPVTGPSPAHALLRAKAVDPVFEINSNYQFYTNKHYVKRGEHSAQEKPVFFTPAGKYKLFNGELKYLASTSKIFKFQEELEKEIIALGRSSRSIKASEFWLGLELHEDIESLDGLSICFDLRNEAHEESFYDSLAKGKWTINKEDVHFIQGLNSNTYDANSLDALLQQELNITTKVNSHISRYYHNKFQTLSDDNFSLKQKLTDSTIPIEFQKIYSKEDLQKIENNLVWIKVEFPQILSPEVFDDLFCSINCFPSINRHLNEFTQSSREFINIIPLLTEELFFDMKRVTSSEGKLFIEKSFSGIGDVDDGSFIVRHGGVGRFDSRNAAEIVSYLLELLRDESAAFSIIGADMISSDLKELNQTITRLEQRLTESNVVKKDISYLLLKSHPDDDTLFIEFWTTNGDFGNKIKSGENLFIYEGSGLWPDSVVTISPTVGGRERMDTEERINAYRKALLSHGRVVTKEDIKALCFEHFGKLLKSVEIKKGLQTGKSTDSGFMQTHDIFLTLKRQVEEIEEEELKYLKKDLLIKLKEQSVSVLPFRCFIE
jgi:hypothetical protein